VERFNPPPGWPVPSGWTPPPEWQPDPVWPAAPPGWQFWVVDDQATWRGAEVGSDSSDSAGTRTCNRRRLRKFLVFPSLTLVLIVFGGLVAFAMCSGPDPASRDPSFYIKLRTDTVCDGSRTLSTAALR